MRHIRTFFAKLGRDQRGLTTVEYAIILCVIVAVAVSTWQEFGTTLNEKLTAATQKIGGAL